MSIATEKLKPASKREQLIRLTAARLVAGTELTSAGGGAYTYSFGFPVAFAGVTHNGTAMTKVASGPTTGEFTVDEATGTVTLVPSGHGSTDYFVITHYLFFTTAAQYVNATEDPLDDTTAMRLWHPRVAEAAEIKGTFKNVRYGYFTLQPTRFTIKNPDQLYARYLGDKDTLYNKDVTIWQTIGSLANCQKVFSGKVASLTATPTTLGVATKEGFFALEQPAYCGIAASKFYFLDSTAFPGHFGQVRRLHMGPSSWYKTTDLWTDASGVNPRQLSDGYRAYCAPYTAAVSKTTNRTWYLGMTYGQVPTQSFGTLQRVTTAIGDCYVKFSSYSNVNVGDIIAFNQGGTVWTSTIRYLGDFTYGGNAYNMIVDDIPINTSATMVPKKAMSLWITGKGDTPIQLVIGTEFSLTEVDIGGGFYEQYITLVDNFETARSWTAVDPNSNEIFYRTSSGMEAAHGSVVQLLLEKAGLTVDATSISDANTALTDETLFSIPNVDESEVQPYSKYLTDILQSTLGFLRMNDAQAVEYKLLAAPSSTDDRSKDLILDGSFSVAIDYQDIVSGLKFENPHLPGGSSAPAVPQSSDVSIKYLHGIDRTDSFRHCLDLSGASLGRQADIFALMSRRAATYQLATATEDTDTLLGDDLQLTHSAVPGGAGVRAVKVISISKSPSKVQLEATDLLGL